MQSAESAKSTAYLKIYQQSRTGVIKASLKTLEAGLPSAVAMLSDDPYAKGSHPFHAYLPYSLHLLKGEFQLWGMSLPSSLESLKMFVSICDACVADLQRLLSPYMHDDKSSKANPVSRMCKLFLMRMDLFSAFLASYQDYRDICHPDSRRESSASLAVKALHDELHSAVVKAIEYLLSPSLAEGLIAGSSSRKQDDGSVCDLHPVTGNCLYVCKEMQAVYTVYYRRIVEVAGGSSLPSDSEEFCVTLLENLFVALEVVHVVVSLL